MKIMCKYFKIVIETISVRKILQFNVIEMHFHEIFPERYWIFCTKVKFTYLYYYWKIPSLHFEHVKKTKTQNFNMLLHFSVKKMQKILENMFDIKKVPLERAT